MITFHSYASITSIIPIRLEFRSISLPAFAFALDYSAGSVVAFDSAGSAAAAASMIGFVAGSSTVAYSNIVGFAVIVVPVIVDPVIVRRQWMPMMCLVPFSLHVFRLCLATELPCWRNSAIVPTMLDLPAAKYPSNQSKQLKRLLFLNSGNDLPVDRPLSRYLNWSDSNSDRCSCCYCKDK